MPRHVDVRIVAATHRTSLQGCRTARFASDLYYRLAVVRSSAVAARPAGGHARAGRAAAGADAPELKIAPRALGPAALAKLAAYAFPGNVRELRNILEQAAILSSSERIDTNNLPLRAGGAIATAGGRAEPGVAGLVAALGPSVDLAATLVEIERALIRRALLAAGGVQAEAARRLGISRSHLAYKLKAMEKAG